MAARRLAETQPEGFAFTPENRAWADREIGKFPKGREASAVISLLWRAQEQEGWVTKPAIEAVASMLGMAQIRVLEVATFYTMFQLEPVGSKAHVQVCGTTPCMLRGAGELIDACRHRIHHDPHHLSADGAFSWEEVECLGACVNAPMIQVSKDTYEDLTRESFEALLDAFARGEQPNPGSQTGRQYSMPVTGATALTEIQYAADDIAPAHSRRSANGTSPRPEHETVGARGEGQAQRQGGTDPSTPAAANQEAGRVDPTGRADEAAARAPAGSGDPPKDVSDTHASGPRNPGPQSDRDSSGHGGKEP